MPDKYEREIEDILRGLKSAESPRDRWPGPNARRRRSTSQLNFSEWCLVIAAIAALSAGGWAYANGANLLTGFVALIGGVCMGLVAISSFIVRQPPSSSRWR